MLKILHKILPKWGNTSTDLSSEKEEQVQEKTEVSNSENIAPEKNFLTRYLDYLKNDHAYLKFKGLSTSHIPPISIDSIYIALKAVAGEGEREEQRIELSEIDKEREKVHTVQDAVTTDFLESNFYQANEAIQNTTSIDDLIAEHPRLVIVGEPGSGKSTVIDYILLRLIKNPQYFSQLFGFKNAPIPLFLPLRFLKPNALPTLSNLSQICLPEILHAQCPEGFFEKYVEAEHCVFLLDGLDEITEPAERRQIRDWIEKLCAAYPENRYIVTSRIVGYRDSPLRNNFQKYRLCDFDWQDIRIFADCWQKAVNKERRGESASDRALRIKQSVDRLIEIINEKPGIRRLAANPLLLTILMLVYNNRARLPEERSRLYEECINVLLEHLQKARMEETQTSAFKPSQALKLEQQRDLLKAMAFYLHKQGLREADEQKVCDEVLANLFPTFGLDPIESAPVFLNDVEELSGLVIRRGGGAGFTHLTFQEYLTAQECGDKESNEAINFLVKQRFSSWWREVIQLYAGIIPDATALIQCLLTEPDTQLHHVLLLTGQCLADARRVKDLKLRQQVIDKLVHLYQSTPFHYIRFQARQVLVRIGTPEVARVFTKMLESHVDDILRIRDAVEVLSRLHTGIEIKRPLVGLLTKSEMPVAVTEMALRGLRNLGQLDDEVQALLFNYMQPEQLRTLRKEAVATLGVLSSDPKVIQRIRNDILENEAYKGQLDAIYVAAAKGFIRHLPGDQALELLLNKIALPMAAEYKVELCRAMKWINVSESVLLEKLLILLKEGVDWGARGGAALTLGSLKEERERIAQALASRLPEEDSIGVRLRLAEALAHMGWLDEPVSQALKQALQEENHFQTRWKLIETYTRLARDENFIHEKLVNPILALPQNTSIENKAIEPIFPILEQLSYYTEELTHIVITRLNDLAEPIAKDALNYISSASFIPPEDRMVLLDYLKNKKEDEAADIVLRNRAFETLYGLWDLLEVDEKQV
jgi:hypothetical protein